VLAAQPMLLELARRCGQPGSADNLEYFLSWAAALRKTPYLVLIAADPSASDEETNMAVDGMSGAVLLFEYRLLGWGMGVFRPEDPTGRRCVIAPPDQRASVTAQACRALLARGAQIVYTAFLHETPDPAIVPTLEATLAAFAHGPDLCPSRDRYLWSVRQQETPNYLPLAATFDETLNRMSQKTRYNLRYYRRRAERDLGCSFEPEVRITLEDLLAFNRACSFPVPDDLVEWRHRILPSVGGGFLSGIRDGDGQWLALVCGRRNGEILEVDWQANRVDLPGQSLSVVARSCLIEHAIAQGCTRMYMEGGTDHPIRRSFAEATVTEFTVMRRSLYARLIRRLAPRITPSWNRLAQIVSDPTVNWRSW